ncbi:MAG: L-threonylcarbamoyladenylate synthase [Spiroplasma sp.]|nr:L-threonylcarbamoyladenylate synthase [Spiroplasma sp.]
MLRLEATELTKIVRILEAGAVIALPTDTVYGLVCKFDQVSAIEKIYLIKQRPVTKPLQILVSNWQQAKNLAVIDDQLIHELEKKFSPGKVTVILKPKPAMIKNDYWNQWDNIAIRVTASTFIQKIIDHVGPLAASSCNLSQESPINESSKINLPNLDYVVNGKIINGKASAVYNSLTKTIIRN